jgi:hypothetical protein
MYRFLFPIFLLMLSLSACKKNKEEEKLPEFGTCDPMTVAGHMSQESASGPFTFLTSGGGKILITPGRNIIISHRDYENFKIEFWGGEEVVNGDDIMSYNHENLNGKHVKDRINTRRTVVFPDGAKITMVAKGPYEEMLSISIYDGAEVHYINAGCNTLEYSTINSTVSKKLDEQEADGETSSFEFTTTGLLYFNKYKEDTPGNKVDDYYKIGELSRDNPTQVRDYYDDPRLGNT